MIAQNKWRAARIRYENNEDCTQQDIADDLGCSRQAVCVKSKKEDWQKLTVFNNEITAPKPGRPRLDTDETIAIIMDTYAMTGNRAMACRQAGIDEKTLQKWCLKDEDLSLTLGRAREAHLIGQYRKIANSKDWKAAKEILARASETRDQWGDIQEKGPTIILNIHRDEVIIES